MTRLGRYEVEGELGRGSMGIVYLAHDPQIRRRVAVKTISLPDGLTSHQRAEFRQRFLREAQAAGSLTHPGIVTIYGVEETDDRDLPIITMEYVAGRNLQHILKTEGRLVPERAFQMAMALAEALQTAHSAGIVHRDIKPANILVRDADGAVKITDFGIARVPRSDLTEGSGILGTPSYMAPEQIRHGIVDSRSDLFALAVILWEALSGERLYSGEDIVSIGLRIVSDPPPSITMRVRGLPPATDAFFEKALAKDPAQRFQNAAAFREAINELLLEIELDQLSAVGVPDSPFVVASAPERPRVVPARVSFLEHWSQSRRLWPVVGGLLLVAVSAMTIKGLSGREPSVDARTSQVQRTTPVGPTEGRPIPAPAAPTEGKADLGAKGPSRPVSADASTAGKTAASTRETAVPAAGSAAPRAAAAPPARANAPGRATDPSTSAPAKTARPVPAKPAPAAPAPSAAVAPAAEGSTEELAAPAVDAEVAPAEGPATTDAPTAPLAPAGGASLVVTLASRIKEGTLVLLLDGKEIYSAELEAHAKRFQRILKKVTQQAQASFEETLDVPPGQHQLTARLTVAGKSNVSEATVDVELEAGGTRTVEIVAGKKFGVGDPLVLKLGD